MEMIKEFLFDIIGLVLPGIVFIFTLTLSIVLITNNSKLIKEKDEFYKVINKFIVLSVPSNGNGTKNIKIDFSEKTDKVTKPTMPGLVNSTIATKEASIPSSEMKTEQRQLYISYVFIFLLFSYLLGHIIKVFSKYFYDFGVMIFDNFLNKINIPLSFRCLTFKKRWVEDFKNKLRQKRDDVFCFSVEPYSKKLFNDVKNKVSDLLHKKYGMEFPGEPNDWFPIYKMAIVIIMQENLSSLTNKFLAKYNLYRSLSFIFFLNFIFISCIGILKPEWLESVVSENYVYIILIAFFSWVTFHVKYKRYWILCGDDALISLFYFLVKERNGN